MAVKPARISCGNIERLKQKRYKFIGMTLFKYFDNKIGLFLIKFIYTLFKF